MLPKKKFAMMLMDQQYCSRKDYAVLETQAVETHIITVNSPEQAIEMAKQLAADGFGAIEVRMYEATGKTVSVGYIVCPEDEKELSDHFWAQ